MEPGCLCHLPWWFLGIEFLLSGAYVSLYQRPGIPSFSSSQPHQRRTKAFRVMMAANGTRPGDLPNTCWSLACLLQAKLTTKDAWGGTQRCQGLQRPSLGPKDERWPVSPYIQLIGLRPITMTGIFWLSTYKQLRLKTNALQSIIISIPSAPFRS